jgi:hypothetical protein
MGSSVYVGPFGNVFFSVSPKQLLLAKNKRKHTHLVLTQNAASCLMASKMHPTALIIVVMLLMGPAAAYPSDPASILAYTKDQALINLQNQVRPSSPASLLGAKLT